MLLMMLVGVWISVVAAIAAESSSVGNFDFYSVGICNVYCLLSVYVARKIFHQVVDGLLYLHSHKILHRDLNLSNILVTKDLKIVSCVAYYRSGGGVYLQV